MPNWVSNYLTVTGPFDDVQRFLDVVTVPEGTREQSYQLTNLRPMPPVLEGTRSPTSILYKLATGALSLEAIQGYVWLTTRTKASATVGQAIGRFLKESRNRAADDVAAWAKAIEAVAQTGYDNWYDWCSTNWGTKWPDSNTACPQDLRRPTERILTFTYRTPWSPMTDLFRYASDQYPTLRFENDAFDEFYNFSIRETFENGTYGSEDLKPTDDPNYEPDSEDDDEDEQPPEFWAAPEQEPAPIQEPPPLSARLIDTEEA